MAKLVVITTTDPDITKYSIKLLEVKTIIVTKTLFKSNNVPDIGSIKIFLRGLYK